MATATSVADPAWRIFKELNLRRQEWDGPGCKQDIAGGLPGINACPSCPPKQTTQSSAKGSQEPVEIWCRDYRE